VWMLCGFILIVLGLIGYTQWPAMVVFLVMFLLPVAYSFMLYMNRKSE